MTDPPHGHPTLVVVTGAAGSGKTTLAHRLAVEIGCPALSRDEIKEGMVAANPGFVAGPFDPLTVRTYGLFFAAIRLFLEQGVTLVVEAAFQHDNWVRGLEPLGPLADLRIVRCWIAPGLAQLRTEQRRHQQPTRAAHDDAGQLRRSGSFEALSLEVPTLDVDTSDGYRPGLDAVLAFCRSW